jgi:hypothetical protein
LVALRILSFNQVLMSDSDETFFDLAISMYPVLITSLLPKEVGMGSRSFEYNPIFLQFVDEKPIRLDMTLPASSVVPDKFMISMNRVKFITLNECTSDDLELICIFPACPHSLDVSF